MNSLSGKSIGDYTIGPLVATGGMGEIYKATKLGAEESMVMKVVRSDLQSDENLRKRFLREIRLMASLEHQNIIPIFDWGYKRKTLYYIMKEIDGPTLAELLETQEFTPDSSRDILWQLANVLDYIHTEGTMHRDVKPKNILLQRREAHWHLYLSDFGLGKNQQRDKLLPMVDRTMGTVEYMAPETIIDLSVDYRTDIYSLSAIAYEMLLGIKPLRVKKSTGDQPKQHLILLPSLVGEDFPYPLEATLLHGLESNRDQRFQSAGQFIEAYDRALAQVSDEQRDTKFQYIFQHSPHMLSNSEPILPES